MPELENVEKVKVAGHVDRKHTNKNQQRIEKEEKELAEFFAKNKERASQNNSKVDKAVANTETTEETEIQDEPTGKEEQTFKKRYGDLRRHLSQKEKEWSERIDTLESQLNLATKNELVLPKTDAEIDAWAKKYPDVASIVETIASKKAKENSKNLDKRLKEIEQIREDAELKKAEAELLALHPDFAEIREKDEFHEWADGQPKWVQDALYENSTDAKAASRVIDLYKADNNKATPNSAAFAVSSKKGRTTPQADETSSYLKESQVNKMTDREYSQAAPQIMEAIKSGKFVYDVSGGAR